LAIEKWQNLKRLWKRKETLIEMVLKVALLLNLILMVIQDKQVKRLKNHQHKLWHLYQNKNLK